jgi:LysR family transcriptional activator of nhaA
LDWLNYHHLLNFWLVAQEGSVRGAAARLQVTPASVSMQVKQLERSMGVKLLKKQGRGLVTTEIGEEVADQASKIFAAGRELMETVNTRPAGRPRPLRVGIRDAMPKLVAFRLLRPALERGEPVRLICEEGDMPRLVADLAVYKLDVILSDTDLDPAYKVRSYSHALGESEIVIMASKELAARFRPGFPGSLHGAPFLFPAESSTLRRSLDRWFGAFHLRPEVRGEFADSAMLKIAGREGMGLFATPACIREDVQRMYGVREVGVLTGVKERFFALSTERKLRHPALMAIYAQAQATTTS